MGQTTLNIPANALGQIRCVSLTSDAGFIFQVENKSDQQTGNFSFKGGSAIGPVSYNNAGDTIAHLLRNDSPYELFISVSGYDFDENYNLIGPDISKNDMDEYFSFLITATGSDFNKEVGRAVVILSPEVQISAPGETSPV